MAKSFNVNTHHAYLNTEIVLSSKLSSVELIDELTGIIYNINGYPLNIKLCAGRHRLYCQRYDEEIIVEIEDAIKLGGGRIREAFVFDDNPWVFVVTKDRLYATNIETKEEKVEFNLVPDKIQGYRKRYGKTCDYFLFKTQNDYSIYNVSTGTHVIYFTDYIFSNSHLVIFKNNKNIIVYDYRNSKTIVEFDGQYSIGSKFYFVKSGKLYGLNLSSDYINLIDVVGKVDKDSILANDYMLKVEQDSQILKTYNLYSLGNGETDIAKAVIKLPYYIESFYGIKTLKFTNLINEYNKFFEENKALLTHSRDLTICCSGIKIDKIQINQQDKTKVFSLLGHLVSYPSKNYKIPFELNGDLDGILDFRNVSFKEYECSIEPKKKVEDITHIIKNGQLLGKSQSENLVVIQVNNCISLHDRLKGSVIQLFENILDTTSYNSAYFSSDGKYVVFENKDKTMGLMGFEDMIKVPFEVEGSTVSRFAGFNGYKPEIIVQETTGRLPVWRDPISLKRIGENEMSNHIFMSPDGCFSAEMQKKTIYYNRLTKLEISNKEYQDLCDKYNWREDASEEEKANKSELRKTLREKHVDDVLFALLYEYIDKMVHNCHKTSTEDEIRKSIERLKRTYIDEYIRVIPKFIPLFIDILDYVCYKENKTGKKNRILIGRNAWFLNYVSFSYNSRYLAFGAKMKEDPWRFSEEGVFEIYDLKDKKVVVRKDVEEELYAVWMTMFSKDGNVAFYDSHANAYVATLASNYETIYAANGKSLLCFSPSGKYIAFSDQNYIDYTHHQNMEWGHQPSGNIFIHKVDDLDTCIEHYNDFGEGIDGTTHMTRRAGNVASAAFSSDERRLLAVGEDGVVVIRNLHLEEYGFLDDLDYMHNLEDTYFEPDVIGNITDPHLRTEERKNYINIHVITNNGIAERFVCWWCSPDEKWDKQQGLILSADGKELRQCVKVDLKTCIIPYGVEKIYPNSFKGIYALGEGFDNELENIYLPSTIKKIDEDIFIELYHIKKIIVEKDSLEKFRLMLPKYFSIMHENDDLP